MNQPKGFRSGLGHHGDDENENERKKKDKGHNKGYFVRGGTQNSNVDGKVKVNNSRSIRSFNIKLKVSLSFSNENVFLSDLTTARYTTRRSEKNISQKKKRMNQSIRRGFYTGIKF